MNYYQKNKHLMHLKEHKTFQIIMLILFLISAFYFSLSEVKIANDMPIWVVCILPVSVYTYQVSRRVCFDMETQRLEVSFFGFFPQKYDLKNFEQLIIINHKMNFINNGKEVKITFKSDKTKEVSLLRKYNFKGIEDFIKETQKIIQGDF